MMFVSPANVLRKIAGRIAGNCLWNFFEEPCFSTTFCFYKKSMKKSTAHAGA
jgi:hypothetical protein